MKKINMYNILKNDISKGLIWWKKFWFFSPNPFGLSLMRLVFGIVAFILYFEANVDYSTLYSDKGLLSLNDYYLLLK